MLRAVAEGPDGLEPVTLVNLPRLELLSPLEERDFSWRWCGLAKEEAPTRQQGLGTDVASLDDGCSFASWSKLLSSASSPSFRGSPSKLTGRCLLPAGGQAAGAGLHHWWLR